jgi:uncharacterized protein (UPF0216 family)
MFIKYSPKDQRIKTIPIVIKASGGKAVPLASNSVILRPGTNELTETEWEAIKPHVQEDIKRKIIVPFTVEVEKAGKVTKARTLKDVPISVARKIIESCQNVDDLKKWVKQELPDEIMLLVLKRLRKFKIDPDELDDAITGEEDSLDADITPEDGDDTPEDGKKGAKGTRKGSKKTPPFDPKPEGSEDEDDEIPDFDGSQGQE